VSPMSKIAVMGQRDAVLGFKASGAVVFAADSPDEARLALEEVKKGDFAILLITEDTAALLKAELSPLYDSPQPVVTILPDSKNPHGMGMELLRKRVERAVGVNILEKREE
jgi:V/A-type H+-transporting ATPase subunit F